MVKAFSRRWLINYVLIILIIVFTYIGNHYQVKTGVQPKNTITRLKPQDIVDISIQTADDQVRLKKTATQWHIEAPFRWPANNVTIERLASIVSSQTDSKLAADQIDLASIGLQFPKAILSLNGQTIYFGITNNIGERRYIMTGKEVFLLADNHLSFMTAGINGLIDRRLLPRSVPLESLQLADLQLAQTDTGGWQNASDPEASIDLLNTLVNNWQTLDARRIKNYAEEITPRQKMVARLKNGREITFFLLSIKPEIIIARPDLGVQYHFDEKRYYDLLAIPRLNDSTG